MIEHCGCLFVYVQVEHYFSINNLVRDMHLRQQMDAEGWVPIVTVAGFKRLAQLSQDAAEIAESLSESITVGGTRMLSRCSVYVLDYLHSEQEWYTVIRGSFASIGTMICVVWSAVHHPVALWFRFVFLRGRRLDCSCAVPT